MPGMRDARFGQFADPNFGASLNQPQAQGVLPAPTQGTSASEMPDDGGSPFHSGLDSQGPGAGAASNPGSIYLADGGAIPDEDGAQDSGDAAPAQSDPFSVVQSALSYGRQKSGLPTKFYGAAPPMSPASPGANPQLSPQSPGAAPQMKPPGFAEGGAIEEDTGTDDQGVIPDGNTDQEDQGGQDQMTPSGNTQPQGQGAGGAMSYLTGQGAVGPEIAQALEQQVDPQGTMDPNQRKMLAVAKAGSPDKAFAVLQHYRQKFNAYSAFAKAAAQGSGGRPPDLHASAHAATQAYQHLPDGNDVSFQPVPNGMRVAVRKVGGEQPQQSEDQGQPTQSFAEGGSVDDDFQYETAGSETPSGSSYDREQQTAEAQPEQPGRGGILGGKAPHESVRDFVLSIPQYLGWLSKDGQADSVFDKGVDSTLDAAAKSPMSPMAGGPSQPQLGGQQPQQQPDAGGGAEPAGADQGVTSQQPTGPRNQNPMQSAHKPSPPDPEKFGAQVAAKASSDGLSLKDAMHQIDIAYGNWMGQQKAKALAKAALIQHYADNKTKVEAEQTRSTRAENVARITGTSRQGVAETNAGARRDVEDVRQTHGDSRNANTNTTKANIAQGNRDSTERRTEFVQDQLTKRNDTTNKPGLVGNKEKIDAAAAARGGPAKMQRPGAQQQQPAAGQTKLVNGKWYKRGPNGEAIEVPGPAQ